jgi:glycosyltransferase involved in cell wall biosynthesis
MSQKLTSIAIIVPDLVFGGAQKILHSYARYEAKRGTKVTVVILFGEKAECFNDNIEYIYLEGTRLIFSITKLFSILKSGHFDIVLTSLKHITIIIELLRLIFFLRFKHIVRIANVYTKELGALNYFKKLFFSFLIRISHNTVHKFICVSKGVALDLRQYTNCNKIEVIYNPVDTKKLDALGADLASDIDQLGDYFIFIGRLSQQKNLYFMLKSYHLIVKKYNLKYKLVLIGEGTEMEGLKRYVKELSLEQFVLFLGYKNNPYPYLRRAKVFLLSSFYEGFPNVLVEALHFGIPIVSVNCEFGPSEIITNPDVGCLVEYYDSEIFAKAVVDVLSVFSFEKYCSDSKFDKLNLDVNYIFNKYHNFIFSK